MDAVEAIKQAQRADAQRETDGTRVRTWSVVDTALHGAAATQRCSHGAAATAAAEDAAAVRKIGGHAITNSG